MESKKIITALIDEWKPRRLLADEIGANLPTVHKWAKANSIPSSWQSAVVAAAKRRGLSYVTPEWMLEAHANQKQGIAA